MMIPRQLRVDRAPSKVAEFQVFAVIVQTGCRLRRSHLTRSRSLQQRATRRKTIRKSHRPLYKTSVRTAHDRGTDAHTHTHAISKGEVSGRPPTGGNTRQLRGAGRIRGRPQAARSRVRSGQVITREVGGPPDHQVHAHAPVRLYSLWVRGAAPRHARTQPGPGSAPHRARAPRQVDTGAYSGDYAYAFHHRAPIPAQKPALTPPRPMATKIGVFSVPNSI